MANLSQVFKDRWRSRKQVGVAKPEQSAKMRKGTFRRAYRHFTFLDGTSENFAEFNRSGSYRGKKPRGAWCNYWHPESDYMDLPNVLDVDTTQDFQGKGITTATIQVENVFNDASDGVLGSFIMFVRGYFAPWRGYRVKKQPKHTWEQLNTWAEMLTGSRQITVSQGYGDAQVTTFTGLVDDVDFTSNPDHITITARDFGGPALTEQRLFGQNKDPMLRPPITFADRLHNERVTEEGRHPRASSYDRSHPPQDILKAGRYWSSEVEDSPNETEWIEIHVRQGRYESFFVDPKWGGMEMWVSVYCKPRHFKKRHRGHTEHPALVDGVEVPEGWYDAGHGVVPGGALDNVPWVKHWNRVDARGHHHRLGGHKFSLGPGSKFRISFKRLHKTGQAAVDPGDGSDLPDADTPMLSRYRAGVQKFVALRREVKEEARKNHWILVDDAADVVKVVLRWAGFREWQVESMGARIAKDKPWVFHQSDFYMDVIDYALSQGNYVFYMDDPSDDDESIGVPTFRHQHAIGRRPSHILQVTDRDLLTGIDIKESAPPRASIIRVRGRESKASERGKRYGPLGEDRTRRVTAVYTPRWTRRHQHGGIMRIETHMDHLIETPEQAKVMCILIAAQMALAAHTGSVEIPGHPGRTLDDQISVADEGTGVNTRLYITSRGSKFTSGENASWKTTLGGALLDTHDLTEIEKDLLRAEENAKHRKAQVEIGSAVHESSGWGRGGAGLVQGGWTEGGA